MPLLYITEASVNISNLWDSTTNQFVQTRRIAEELDLSSQTADDLENFVANLDVHHRHYHILHDSALSLQSWIGRFQGESDDEPTFLFQTSAVWNPPSLHLDNVIKNAPPSTPLYVIGERSKNLIKIDTSKLKDKVEFWNGIFRQARVVQVARNNDKRKEFLVYCSRPRRIKGLDLAH